MTDFFRFLDLDQISFWIGFLAGILTTWLAILARPVLRDLLKIGGERLAALRASLTTGSEARYRADLLRYAQGQHLASQFFSLDEILIPPRILAPPVIRTPDGETPAIDGASQVIAYMPDWPEMASIYHAPTLSLAEAMQKGVNLILVGHPGYGKTVALAHLASLVASQNPQCGVLSSLLPVMVHIGDLPLPLGANDTPVDALAAGAARYTSALVLPRLAAMIRQGLDRERLLLLLDGLDELPAADVLVAVQFIRALLEKHPRLRLVIAASPGFYDGLASLGLVPVAIASWGKPQTAACVQKWVDLWGEVPANLALTNAPPVDPHILTGWMAYGQLSLTPLEVTLKVWAMLAGDALGPSGKDALEAHIRRLGATFPAARPALEKLAGQALQKARPFIPKIEAGAWVAELAQVPLDAAVAAASVPDPGPQTTTQKNPEQKAADQKVAAARQALASLQKSGLLVDRGREGVGFAHPTLGAYLASFSGFQPAGNQALAQQPLWSLLSQALAYRAAAGELSGWVASQQQQHDEPLYRNQTTLARWLRLARKDAAWAPGVMRQLAFALQDETLPVGLRTRYLTALAFTGDPGITALFRRLLSHEHPHVRRLACLGCGLLQDAKLIPDVSNLLGDLSLEVRTAACLALGVIGGNAALETVATVLVQGEESLRQVAAEVLADFPDEGHETLREGAAFDDILVRRAVVFGLAKVRQPWAEALLDKMQVEDSQWVVRDAAEHALQQLRQPHPAIPAPLPPLANTPWLIAYAGERGRGISSTEAAREMLAQAIKDGSEAQKMAGVSRVSRLGTANEGLISLIYHALYGNQTELRELAYQTLAHLGSAGVSLPSPMQYGFS